MNSKQIKEAKRGVAMVTFAEARVADFTHTPPMPVDAKHAATLGKANAAIAGLGGKQAIQMAGEHGQATENLRSDRGDVGAMLRKINATVAAMNGVSPWILRFMTSDPLSNHLNRITFRISID